jgi:hypothetical protein
MHPLAYLGLLLMMWYHQATGANEERAHMRFPLIIVLVIIGIIVIGSIWSQESSTYRSHVFADRSILLPNSPYPIVALAGDMDRNIYVLAWDQLVRLDPKGEVLLRLPFQKGQGPGEVQNLPASLALGLDSLVYINDGNKILVYDSNLKFVRNLNIRPLGNDFFVDKVGNLYCRKSDFGSSDPQEFVAKYNDQGILSGAFLKIPDLALSISGGIAVRTPHAYIPKSIYCLDSHGSLFLLPNTGSQVLSLDSQGKALPAFRINVQKIPISTAEKSEIEKIYVESMKSTSPFKIELRFADFRPFYSRMLIDEMDRFYLVRTKSVLDKRTEVIVDVYQNGRKVKEVLMGGDPTMVMRGNLYFINNKDDGIGEPVSIIWRTTIY